MALKIPSTHTLLSNPFLDKSVLKMNHHVFSSSAFMVFQSPSLEVPPGSASKNKSSCGFFSLTCLLIAKSNKKKKKKERDRKKYEIWCLFVQRDLKDAMGSFQDRSSSSPPACLCGGLKASTVSEIRSNKNDMLYTEMM